MNKACDLFLMDNPFEAEEHIAWHYEIVEDYGDYMYGHWLHTWDDGRRMLARCLRCGGLVLIQRSEFHGMEYDDYYRDYFPVTSAEEADELNRKYDGFEIEKQYPGKYLIADFGRVPHWSKKYDKPQNKEEEEHEY